MAADIESAVNTCSGPKEHLQKLLTKPYAASLRDFFLLCILYWSETDRYDPRNEYAVLASKVIAREFELTVPDDGTLAKEAYGFTHCAHRYLQYELFKVILEKLKTNRPEITSWFESKEFVYNDTHTELIPYADYLKNRKC